MKVGESIVEVYEVREEDMPKCFPKPIPVLSTPSMISMIERASMKLAQKFLREGKITVGTRVDVRHLRPAPVGAKVEVHSKLVKVEGRKLEFEVKVLYKGKEIGVGKHERYIVDAERFESKGKSS